MSAHNCLYQDSSSTRTQLSSERLAKTTGALAAAVATGRTGLLDLRGAHLPLALSVWLRPHLQCFLQRCSPQCGQFLLSSTGRPDWSLARLHFVALLNTPRHVFPLLALVDLPIVKSSPKEGGVRLQFGPQGESIQCFSFPAERELSDNPFGAHVVWNIHSCDLPGHAHLCDLSL
jgi:hypothetical protein